MTLLTSVKAICRETGLLLPSSIVGNDDDENAVRLLGAASRAGKFLGRKEFPEMVKLHTVTTSSGTADYAFPSDFLHFVKRTSWNTTNTRMVGEAITPEDWRRLQHGSIAISAITDVWRVTKDSSDNRQLSIYPQPAATESIVFEYIMNTWCEKSDGTAQTDWAADTDITILPDYIFELELKWRVLDVVGMPYAEAKAEAEDECEIELLKSKGVRVLSLDAAGMSGNWVEAVNIPEGNFTL